MSLNQTKCLRSESTRKGRNINKYQTGPGNLLEFKKTRIKGQSTKLQAVNFLNATKIKSHRARRSSKASKRKRRNKSVNPKIHTSSQRLTMTLLTPRTAGLICLKKFKLGRSKTA